MAKKDQSAIRIEGDLAYLSLTQGYEAIIDASDVDLVSGYKWYAWVRRRKDNSIYAVYAITGIAKPGRSRGTLRLHRLIMGAPSHLQVDHVDGDGLLNTRANLRLCTAMENQRNQRRKENHYKGTSFDASRNKWTAHIRINKRLLHLGSFVTAEEAALAYDRASLLHYGEFAKPNGLVEAA